jgi:hypothetical protein
MVATCFFIAESVTLNLGIVRPVYDDMSVAFSMTPTHYPSLLLFSRNSNTPMVALLFSNKCQIPKGLENFALMENVNAVMKLTQKIRFVVDLLRIKPVGIMSRRETLYYERF